MKRLGRLCVFCAICFIVIYGLVKFTNVKDKLSEAAEGYYEQSREAVNEDELMQRIVSDKDIDVNGVIDTAEELTNKALENVTPENMESLLSKVWKFVKNILTFLFDSAETLAKNAG